MYGYQAERVAVVKRQKVDDGLVMLFVAPTVDVKYQPNLNYKKISDAQRDYRRYHGVVDEYDGFPGDTLAEVAAGFDNIFSQQGLWEAGGCALFGPWPYSHCYGFAAAFEDCPNFGC